MNRRITKRRRRSIKKSDKSGKQVIHFYKQGSVKSSNPKKSPTNEDSHAVRIFKNGNKIFLLAGVFDGHSGNKISRYSSKYFIPYLAKKIINEGTDKCVFKCAFKEFNDKLKSLRTRDGSTVTIIYLDHDKYICANGGDSPAYLVKCSRKRCKNLNDVKIHKLSTDHDYYNNRERTRVTNLGGKFLRDGYYCVGDYCIEPLRGFGDFPIKSKKGPKGVDIHTAEPTVMERKLTGSDRFIIITSDGIEPNRITTSVIKNGYKEYYNNLSGYYNFIMKSKDIFGPEVYRPDDTTVIIIDVALFRKILNRKIK